MKRKKRCTLLADGKIIAKKNRGLDFPTSITVEYMVNGITYQITESVKLKSKIIKLCILPIGQERFPRLPSIAVGSHVKVCYNPNNPKEAYLKDNVGIMNC